MHNFIKFSVTKSKFAILYFIGSVFFLSTVVGCAPKTTKSLSKQDSGEKSLLWKIEGNGLSKPSYLFGTIHLIPQDKYFFTNVMNKAFSDCDEVVFEIDMNVMNDINEMFGILAKIRMPDDMTIKDLLNEADYNLFEEKFADKGLPAFLLETIKPLFISTLADGMDGQNQSMMSYEMELTEKANAQNKVIGGLETIDDQLAAIDSIPLEVQAKMLMEELRKEGSDNDYQKLIDLYLHQDIDALQTAINQDNNKEDAKMMKFLLKDRNLKWIPKMSAMMLKQPTFFAVGAGHLGGEYGVINLLKEAGYKVTPVR